RPWTTSESSATPEAPAAVVCAPMIWVACSRTAPASRAPRRMASRAACSKIFALMSWAFDCALDCSYWPYAETAEPTSMRPAAAIVTGSHTARLPDDWAEEFSLPAEDDRLMHPEAE